MACKWVKVIYNIIYARQNAGLAMAVDLLQAASRAKSCPNTHVYVQACSSAKHTYLSRLNAPTGKLMA